MCKCNIMATTKVKDSRQKKLTTTPTPAPSDSRRQNTRPSPSSSSKSSRSTSPTSPKRGRPFVPSSTGTKPLPNYLKPTESSRTISGARLAESSSKHIKKHTTTSTTTITTTTGHDTKAASNRRRSIDRSTSSSALPSSHHVHTKVGTSVPPIRERLAARSTSFASHPATASHRVQSKAPIATTTVSNKSHVSSGSGKGALKKTPTATKKEVLENESSNALEKVSGVAGIGDEQQMPSAEAIEELTDIEQNKVGANKEEIPQELEIPYYPESEDIIETEIKNARDDFLEPVEETHDADQIKQTEETILEDKILEPDDDNNNNNNHEDNGEQMDEVKGENKSVSPPPAKSSSIEETDSKAEEDNHKEDTDENLDHAVRKEENSAPEAHEEEDGKKEAETCNEKEEVVVVEEESPAAKSVPVEEEAPKTSKGATKGPAGKKDSPAYNDVIEETATKLLEKRKNKVKALVGAFETVISLDAN